MAAQTMYSDACLQCGGGGGLSGQTSAAFHVGRPHCGGDCVRLYSCCHLCRRLRQIHICVGLAVLDSMKAAHHPGSQTLESDRVQKVLPVNDPQDYLRCCSLACARKLLWLRSSEMFKNAPIFTQLLCRTKSSERGGACILAMSLISTRATILCLPLCPEQVNI